ncbi:pilus assembly FimT family protein [Iocasia frigidifontis]|nr:type II secretion system GspH family protein [Iocasia fonsfrigidae]
MMVMKTEVVKGQMLLTGRERGTTLIEVLILMMLIAVVSAVIIPSFGGLKDSIMVNTYQRKIDRYFNIIRRSAVNSGQEETINLGRNNISCNLSNGESLKLDFADENILTLEYEEKQIIFYPDGTSSGGEILLVFNKKERYYFQINSITGETGWYEP